MLKFPEVCEIIIYNGIRNIGLSDRELKMKKSRYELITVLIISIVLTVAAESHSSPAEKTALELIAGLEPPDGWDRSKEPASYGPDNLWEYINGSADKFISYDFVQAAVQDFKDGQGNELKVEIYQHADDKLAYGIFSQFSRLRETSRDIGHLTFSGGYSLHFWKGDFYVKISVFEENEQMKKAMRSFAAALAGRIKEMGSRPECVRYLPEEGLDDKSVSYVASGVLGSGSLPPAVTADYTFGEKKGVLYLFSFDTARQGKAMFKEFSGEITGKPQRVIYDQDQSYSRVRGGMKYRGDVVLFQYDRIAGVITGFADSTEETDRLEKEVIKSFIREGEPLVK